MAFDLSKVTGTLNSQTIESLKEAGGGGDLSDYVKKTDIAGTTSAKKGIIWAGGGSGLAVSETGHLHTNTADQARIDGRTAEWSQTNSRNNRDPITPAILDYAVRSALSDRPDGFSYSSEQQRAAKETLGITNVPDTIPSEIGTVTGGTIELNEGVLPAKIVVHLDWTRTISEEEEHTLQPNYMVVGGRNLNLDIESEDFGHPSALWIIIDVLNENTIAVSVQTENTGNIGWGSYGGIVNLLESISGGVITFLGTDQEAGEDGIEPIIVSAYVVI